MPGRIDLRKSAVVVDCSPTQMESKGPVWWHGQSRGVVCPSAFDFNCRKQNDSIYALDFIKERIHITLRTYVTMKLAYTSLTVGPRRNAGPATHCALPDGKGVQVPPCTVSRMVIWCQAIRRGRVTGWLECQVKWKVGWRIG